MVLLSKNLNVRVFIHFPIKNNNHTSTDVNTREVLPPNLNQLGRCGKINILTKLQGQFVTYNTITVSSQFCWFFSVHSLDHPFETIKTFEQHKKRTCLDIRFKFYINFFSTSICWSNKPIHNMEGKAMQPTKHIIYNLNLNYNLFGLND